MLSMCSSLYSMFHAHTPHISHTHTPSTHTHTLPTSPPPTPHTSHPPHTHTPSTHTTPSQPGCRREGTTGDTDIEVIPSPSHHQAIRGHLHTFWHLHDNGVCQRRRTVWLYRWEIITRNYPLFECGLKITCTVNWLCFYLISVKNGKSSERESRRVFQQIISGVDYCHR